MNSEEEHFYNSFTNVLTLYGIEICTVWLCIPTFYKMTLSNKNLKFTPISLCTNSKEFEYSLKSIENVEKVNERQISIYFNNVEFMFYCVSQHACDVVYDGLCIILKYERQLEKRRRQCVRIILNESEDSDESDESN
jgi:hypothetical protein